MKELVGEHQAHMLMLGVLIVAPLIGALWGVFKKRLLGSLIVGLLVGFGNYALWSVYNAITEHLGLDTVENLLVNLGLFVMIGITIGLVTAWISRNKTVEQS